MAMRYCACKRQRDKERQKEMESMEKETREKREKRRDKRKKKYAKEQRRERGELHINVQVITEGGTILFVIATPTN